ncbi:glutamate receptor ionotropic, delta-2-like [Panulirus ornatus]|uniref:glutamate receptor ionotropic, delta-2-like n=1 Tax=Panulirus ornatus TaxID=150431 RepID=UPI003A89ABFB
MMRWILISLLELLLLGVGVEVLTEKASKKVVVVGGLEEEVRWQVGVMVGQVVKQHLAGCHLVLATANTQHSPVLYQVLRYLAAEVQTGLVVEMGSLLPQGASAAQDVLHDHFLKRLWGDGSSTCHALILDYTSGDAHSTVRFLELCGLWLRPDTRVMFVSNAPEAETVLLQHSLRNTLHALYLLLKNKRFHDLEHNTGLKRGNSKNNGRVNVEVYRRCMYCSGGEAGVQLLHRWDLRFGLPTDLPLFREEPENFMGHKFQSVDKTYFPYFTFERSSDTLGTVVYPQDSLNTRMINAIASHFNFTYEVREPLDGKWGLPGKGKNWTGIIGTLQHQQADFTLDITLTPQRAEVVEFSRVYIDESIVILSSKPRPLPEYLSLIRPLAGELWLILLVSVGVWGVMLWLLQKAWSWASGGRGFNLSSSLFYSLGIMLEDPPNNPPRNITAQVLVGWWLVFCLVVTTAYRSSLISHLVVQGKSPVINSMEDLVARQGWNWGTPRMTGALLLVLSTSPYPAVQKVYKGMQANSIDEGLQLVLEGGYAFIYSKYFLKTLIATRYTDDFGYTPLHISATEYPLFAGNGWAFRRGTPFRRRLDRAIQRLLEAGLVTFWMDDVITTHVRNTWHIKQKDTNGSNANVLTYQKDDDEVVLGLHHLQVTFFLLFVGCSVALITFVMEQLVHTYF